MDRLELSDKISAAFKKYKYALLIVAVGILLMMFPQQQEQTEQKSTIQSEETAARDITDELTQIIGQIQGVGKVKIMLTEMRAAETVYQEDEDRDETADTGSVRTETVLIGSGSGQQGLIRTVTPPVYLGAIVVCQGADNAAVRLSIAQAVAAVTGISMDRISVLKMK